MRVEFTRTVVLMTVVTPKGRSKRNCRVIYETFYSQNGLTIWRGRGLEVGARAGAGAGPGAGVPTCLVADLT